MRRICSASRRRRSFEHIGGLDKYVLVIRIISEIRDYLYLILSQLITKGSPGEPPPIEPLGVGVGGEAPCPHS